MARGVIKILLRRVGIGVCRLNPSADTRHWLRPHLDMVLAWLNERLEGRVSFVQIGANEGGGNDPIQHWITSPGWQGLLVEPLPDVMKRLRERHAGREHLRFCQCVVSGDNGTVTFYRPYADYHKRLPAGSCTRFKATSSIASLDPHMIARHIGWEGDPLIVAEPVQVDSMSLPTLLHRHDLKAPDLLQIDAEGHDLAILRQVDFKTCRPKVINFEHIHLGADYQNAIALLTANDYLWSQSNMDITAVDSRWFVAG